MKFLTFALVLMSTPAFATLDYEEIDYDTLVSRYSEPNRQNQSHDSLDLLNDVKFHFDVGMSYTTSSIKSTTHSNQSINQGGVQVALGVDLFNPEWIAEFAYINYGEKEYEDLKIKLNEFDLRVYHKTNLKGLWGFRLGSGITARYIKFSDEAIQSEYSSPTTILFAGLETRITKGFSIVSEVSMKNSLITDTPEKTAYDLNVKLSGSF